MRILFGIFCLAVLGGCTGQELTATEIINRSVVAYGGQKVFNSIIEFDFRDKHYVARYQDQSYSLKRIFSDSTGNIVDELTNDGFVRTRNGNKVDLDEEWTGKYSRSVNSVIYFFRIPFVLKDPAVRPELIGETVFAGKDYYKLRVSFSEANGGDDFDDTFVYWIAKDSYMIDYFAYSYSTSGGGKRFRKRVNPRRVDGLLVADYINFEPVDLKVPIEQYDAYYPNGGLKELSRIINKNVSIKYLD